MASQSLIAYGQGEPVLLIHGSLSSKIQWLPLMQASQAYQWFAVDLLGYGQRDPFVATGPLALEDEAAMIHEELPKLESPITIVGHSYGGAVASAFALRYPERVKQLILYEPVLFGVLSDQSSGLKEVHQVTERIYQAVDAEGWAKGTELFMDYWSGEGTFNRLPTALREAFVKVMPKVPHDFEAIETLRFTPDALAALDIPVHLMQGKRSRVSAHEVIQVLLRAIPKSTFQAFDKAGHMGPVTHKEAINQAILERLSL